MKYAAVIIPTLCRYEHFYKCIESLRKNSWAKFTDVYVGLDFPAKDSHVIGHDKIAAYLNGEFPEFNNFNVIKRDKNYGSYKNSVDLKDRCTATHDRFIYAEDDLEFSPDFLEFMDVTLERYENDPDVIGVTGYSSPVAWKVSDGCGAFKQNFAAYTWGIGRYRDKNYSMCKYLSKSGLGRDFYGAYKTGKLEKLTDWAFCDYSEHVTDGVSPHSIIKYTTDVSMRLYLAVKDCYMITPIISKVRNNGFDGSGIYCPVSVDNENRVKDSQNYDYSSQPIDTESEYTLDYDDHIDMEYNRNLYNRFDRVDAERLESAKRKAEYYCAKSRLWRKTLNYRRLLVSIMNKIGVGNKE